MIKLNQTQAKAVASKIRERILQHNREVRKQIKDAYVNSDDYKNKQREIREMVIVVYQTQTKVGRKYGLACSTYNYQWMYSEDDIEKVVERLCEDLIADYIKEHDNTKNPPSEEQLVTDLIFQSLTSDKLEDLMNTFIEPYL